MTAPGIAVEMNLEVPFSIIDDIVETVRATHRVPGIAVAVVSAEGPVHRRAYGWASLERRTPLHVDMAYPIASTTKAMNATLLGKLVEAGQLEWDAPLSALNMGAIARHASQFGHWTLRDLVAMRTGLPRHDWIWFGRDLLREDLSACIAALEFPTRTPAVFIYNNLTPSLAGHIAELVLSRPWEEALFEMVLAPLDIGTLLPGTRDHIVGGYRETFDRIPVPVPAMLSKATAPSGGLLHATLDEMAKWVRFNLTAGGALLSSRGLAEIHTGHVAIDGGMTHVGAAAKYGLGWIIDDYSGHRRLSHGGLLNDVHSDIQLFPDVGLALVCFSNFGAAGVAGAINELVFCALADASQDDMTARKLIAYSARVAARHPERALTKATAQVSPDPASCAGLYRHDAYGVFEIAAHGTGILLRRERIAMRLRALEGDCWVGSDLDEFSSSLPHPVGPQTPLRFMRNVQSEITGFTLALEPAAKPAHFARVR